MDQSISEAGAWPERTKVAVNKEKLVTEGVRTIAILEASKGIIVLIAGFGLLSLVHHNLQEFAEHLVRLSHLNPARHYPRIFIEAATHTSSNRLRAYASLAFLYSSLRFTEAYGLWRTRAWAEWFAIVSGSTYLPFEIHEILNRPTYLRLAVLLSNLVIVAYMAYVRWISHQARKALESTTGQTVPIVHENENIKADQSNAIDS